MARVRASGHGFVYTHARAIPRQREALSLRTNLEVYSLKRGHGIWNVSVGVFCAIMKPHLTANYSLANGWARGCSACERVWNAASRFSHFWLNSLSVSSSISATTGSKRPRSPPRSPPGLRTEKPLRAVALSFQL